MRLRSLLSLMMAIMIASIAVTGVQAFQGAPSSGCETMAMGKAPPPISDGCCDNSCLVASQTCWQCAPAVVSDALGLAADSPSKMALMTDEQTVRAKTLSQPDTPPPRS